MSHEGLATGALERRVVRKLGWRLVPLVTGVYLIASLDRANVSFAALTMNRDLGISPLIYGWGAGIYFIGSLVMGIPSNLLFERIGGRRTLAIIAVIWGLVAASQALIVGSGSFLVMRLLLGLAEAGLFPIVVLYLGIWFPARFRARVMALFLLANPLSSAIGGLLAGPLLMLNGLAGLHGWQWMFVVEALPPLFLSWLILRWLPDHPDDAPWLQPEERRWLTAAMAAQRPAGDAPPVAVWRTMTNGTVMIFCVVYFGRMMALFGVTFFLPLIFKGLGFSTAVTGYVSAVPFTAAVIGMLVWAHYSDRAADRRWHLLATHLVTAAGLVAAALCGTSYWSILAMCVASIGFSAEGGVFWSLPSMMLPAGMAAVGIAWINAVGVLGAIFGPFGVGLIRQQLGDYTVGLYFLALFVGAVGALVAFLPGLRRPQVQAGAVATVR
jgi:MFS transporter, ACS family, tartrate transporter